MIKFIFRGLTLIHICSIFVVLNMVNKCSRNKADKFVSRTATYDLDVKEPSGLAFDEKQGELWIVSDHNQASYQTDLEGKIKQTYHWKVSDPEGIALSQDGSTVYLADERKHKILGFSRNGEKVFDVKLDLKKDHNNGLEGLAIGRKTGTIYAIKEAEPSQFITLNKEGEVNKHKLTFFSDFSGVYIDNNETFAYLISDEDASLAKYDFHKQEVVWKTCLGIEKIEGISIDESNKKLFVVSDKNNQLYIYDIKL